MRTKIDPDDEFFISEFDFSQGTLPNPFATKPGEKTEIRIDAAVAYQLRLIPSNKVLARFDSTLEAWPAIIATVEGGRSPRTLSLDWQKADGTTGSIAAGPWLERFARLNNGEPDRWSDQRVPKSRPGDGDPDIAPAYDFTGGRRGVRLDRARRGIRVVAPVGKPPKAPRR